MKVDIMKNRAKRFVPFVLAMIAFAMLVGFTEPAEAATTEIWYNNVPTNLNWFWTNDEHGTVTIFVSGNGGYWYVNHEAGGNLIKRYPSPGNYLYNTTQSFRIDLVTGGTYNYLYVWKYDENGVGYSEQYGPLIFDNVPPDSIKSITVYDPDEPPTYSTVYRSHNDIDFVNSLTVKVGTTTLGIAYAQYSTDNTNWTVWYPAGFVAPEGSGWVTFASEGLQTLYARGKDSAGNISDVSEAFPVRVDTTPPTIDNYYLSGTLGSGGWYTSQVELYVSTSDDQRMYDPGYRVDGGDWGRIYVYGPDYTSGTGSRSFLNDGHYQIEFYGEDFAKNVTSTFTITIKIDTVSPTASFTYSPSTPNVDEIISFTDQSSDYRSGVASWSWSFGDGTTSTQRNPTYSYTSAGSYQVTLTVTDSAGLTDSITKTVTVSEGEVVNQPPTANFTYSPSSPQANETISFTDQSSDPDGSVVSWSWAFGDGSTSTLQNPTHSYGVDGSYNVTLTVTDNGGATDSITKTITVGEIVTNQPPTASFTYFPSTPRVNGLISFTDQSTDPDGQIVSWNWDFGDGSTSAQQNSSHSYASSGNYQASLTVTDNGGATDNTTKTVTVSGRLLPPEEFTVTAPDEITCSPGEPITIPITIVGPLENFDQVAGCDVVVLVNGNQIYSSIIDTIPPTSQEGIGDFKIIVAIDLEVAAEENVQVQVYSSEGALMGSYNVTLSVEGIQPPAQPGISTGLILGLLATTAVVLALTFAVFKRKIKLKWSR